MSHVLWYRCIRIDVKDIERNDVTMLFLGALRGVFEASILSEWASKVREWEKKAHTKRMLHLQVQSSMHFFGLVVFRKVNDSHCSFVEVGFHMLLLSFIIYMYVRVVCVCVFACVGFQRFIYLDAHGILFYASILSV